MPDRFEQETVKELSESSMVNDPFKNLEKVLIQLENIEIPELDEKIEKYDHDDHILVKEKEVTRGKENIFIPSNDLNTVLANLGAIFKICRLCKQKTLKEELISGVCFECHQKKEKIHADTEELFPIGHIEDLLPLVSRISDLATQVEDIKTEPKDIKLSKESMDQLIGTITDTVRRDIQTELNIGNILETVRKDIQTELKEIKHNLMQAERSPSPPPPPPNGSNVPPPPPPPRVENEIKNGAYPNSSEINFSIMTLEELKTFTPEVLESLSLMQRNQYNTRLKELQELDQMSPEERKEYILKKNREKEQSGNFKMLKDSLISLAESDNKLFIKMRKKANNSILAGQGTLGKTGPKLIFVHCYKCNETNEIIEGGASICKNCKSPLNKR